MKWLSSFRRDQRGGALLIALIFSAVLVIVAVGVIASSTLEYRMAANNTMKKQAQYAAEAAVEVAKSQLKSEPAWTPGASWTPFVAGESEYRFLDFTQIGVFRSFEVESRVKDSVYKNIKVWLTQGWNNTVLAGRNLTANVEKIENASLAANSNVNINAREEIKNSQIAGLEVTINTERKKIKSSTIAGLRVNYDSNDLNNSKVNLINPFTSQPIPNFNVSKFNPPEITYDTDKTFDSTVNKFIRVNGNVTLNGEVENGVVYATGNVTINDKVEKGIIYAAGTVTVNTDKEIKDSVIIANSIIITRAEEVEGILYSTGSISITSTDEFEFEGAMVAQYDVTINTADGKIKGPKKEKHKKEDDDHEKDKEKKKKNPEEKDKGTMVKALEVLNTNAPGALDFKWMVAKWVELN